MQPQTLSIKTRVLSDVAVQHHLIIISLFHIEGGEQKNNIGGLVSYC